MKVAYKKYRKIYCRVQYKAGYKNVVKKYYKDTIDRIYSKEIVFYINLKKVFLLRKIYI